MQKIRILLVDDHAILRVGLASLLNSKKDLEVVGEAENGETALALAKSLNPDVFIVDLMMPGMDGAETTRRLIAQNPNAKIMILTTFGTADGIAHALASGAKGAMMKNVDVDELVEGIRAIAAGGSAVCSELRQILAADPALPALTPRQSEILESIVRGLSNKDIALQLGISVNVVKEHVNSLYLKIGAANRTEAVAIALRKHLLKI